MEVGERAFNGETNSSEPGKTSNPIIHAADQSNHHETLCMVREAKADLCMTGSGNLLKGWDYRHDGTFE